jgi:hypothetical protein
MARVLLVGYEPEIVDFSNPALPPGTDDRSGMGGRSLPHPS